jgi:adenylosuccinate lyase
LLPGYADVAWQNLATGMLERTLDDSANMRICLPEAFLTVDHMLQATLILLPKLEVDLPNLTAQLNKHLPEVATAALLASVHLRGLDPNQARIAIRDAFNRHLYTDSADSKLSLAQNIASDERVGMTEDEVQDILVNYAIPEGCIRMTSRSALAARTNLLAALQDHPSPWYPAPTIGQLHRQ